MPRLPVIHDLSAYAYTVIANSQADASRAICELGLDRRGFGVPKGVDKGFPRNPGNLVADYRIERLKSTQHRKAESGTMVLGKFLPPTRQHVRQFILA